MRVMVGIVDVVLVLLMVEEARARDPRALGDFVMSSDRGRVILAFFAGDSKVAGKVVVEAFWVSLCGTSEVLEELEI